MPPKKKKSAKKKSTKKKAAKKKTAKKKATATPKKYKALQGKSNSFWQLPDKLGAAVFPDDCAEIVVVRFNDVRGLNRPKARRSNDDQVWFRNEGPTKRRLTLDHWVFLEPEASILVPAKSSVGPFHLDPACPYIGHVETNPAPPSQDGPPGDPGFDTDG